MKKVMLFLLVLAVNLNAQSFKLTPKGFVDSSNETADFVVLNFENKSKKEIFDLVNAKVVSMFVSAKNVISYSGEDVITVNGVSTKDISFNSAFNYTMNYTIVLMFKDGKLRMNAPSLNKIAGTFGDVTNRKELILQGNGGGMLPVQCVFNNKGELKRDKNKEELESFFNGFLEEMKKGVELPTNW
jgi:hypothetical protein